MRLSHSVLVLFLLLSGLPLLAASSTVDAPHLRVELLTPGGKLYDGNQLNYAGLYFKLEAGWHIYWMNAGDAGDPPRIRWTLSDGITAGAMQFPTPKRLPLGSLMDYGYEDEVLFPVEFHVANGLKAAPVTLHAKVDWLVCRDSCIPGSAELELQRSVDAGSHRTADEHGPLFQRFLNRIPRPLPGNGKAHFQATKRGFLLAVETGQQESSAAFFPSDPDIIDNPSPQKITPTPNGLILDLKKDAALSTNPIQLKGVLELSGERAFEITAAPGEVVTQVPPPSPSSVAAIAPATPLSVPSIAPKPSHSAPTGASSFFWAVLLKASGLAFLGGLLLNLMPCVFPVLFLKGLALVNSGNEDRNKLRTHGMIYAAGILVSFWLLVGALLALRAAGSTLGWGFQFQSPIFLSLMAGVLFFLGLSLAGQFEIGLTLTSVGGSLAAKHGLYWQLFYWSVSRHRRHALHRALHGSGYRLCAHSIRCGHLRRLHGARRRPRRAVRCAHAAIGLDALLAQARSVDGSSAAGCRRANFHHRYLASVGADEGLRRRYSLGIAGELLVAGDCGLVSRPLACQALVRRGCRIDFRGCCCTSNLRTKIDEQGWHQCDARLCRARRRCPTQWRLGVVVRRSRKPVSG